MDILDKLGKAKPEKMSDQKAIEILKEWAEELEVDSESKDFEDVIKALKIPVQKDKLKFIAENRSFELVLFDPIEKHDGSKISKLTIRSTTMAEKKGMQNFKESQRIDQSMLMISEACDLELGFVERLKDKDLGRINAVVLGFLA